MVHVKIKRRIQLNPLFILDNLASKWVRKQTNRIYGENEIFQTRDAKGMDKWILRIISAFGEWNKERCFQCGCKETYEDDFDYFNHMVCEYTVKCKNCDTTINAYAYGNFQEPTTRLGAWGMELHYLRLQLIRKAKKLKPKISK